ncbi:hypothetical protein MCP1_490015 [Candidatus Terasakiella magnetica]|nr:hypothetical protein MCP1_490015 [Candidatus Terasakiella magnetica]
MILPLHRVAIAGRHTPRTRSLRWYQQLKSHHRQGGLSPGFKAKVPEYGRHVELHGALGEAEIPCDFLVGFSVDDPFQNFPLAWRQDIDPHARTRTWFTRRFLLQDSRRQVHAARNDQINGRKEDSAGGGFGDETRGAERHRQTNAVVIRCRRNDYDSALLREQLPQSSEPMGPRATRHRQIKKNNVDACFAFSRADGLSEILRLQDGKRRETLGKDANQPFTKKLVIIGNQNLHGARREPFYRMR